MPGVLAYSCLELQCAKSRKEGLAGYPLCFVFLLSGDRQSEEPSVKLRLDCLTIMSGVKVSKPEPPVVAPEGTSFFRAVNFERYAVRTPRLIKIDKSQCHTAGLTWAYG